MTDVDPDDVFHTPPASVRYPVRALVRDPEAALRADFASRELARLVAEIDPDAAVTLDICVTPG